MVQQLVLPKSHRAEVMKLGHDIEWGKLIVTVFMV